VSDHTETLLRARVAELEAALTDIIHRVGGSRIAHTGFGRSHDCLIGVEEVERWRAVLSSGADHANPAEATS
jgi:hypothetical protein